MKSDRPVETRLQIPLGAVFAVLLGLAGLPLAGVTSGAAIVVGQLPADLLTTSSTASRFGGSASEWPARC